MLKDIVKWIYLFNVRVLPDCPKNSKRIQVFS